MSTQLSAEKRVEFLRLSARLEEMTVPKTTRVSGVLLSVLSLAFIAWTGIAMVEEIVYAQGDVVPVGFTQTIQHFDGGIVAAIPVHEGSFVKKGDLLLRLDGTGVQEELAKAQILRDAYARKVATAERVYSIQEDLQSKGVSSEVRFLDARQALNDARSSFEQQKQVIASLEGKVARLMVVAPVDGAVKGLRINTIGAVIKPGDPLMEIVPSDRSLVVEARVWPSDVGQIREGQDVKIKITAYDYARYGAITGKLEFITATTFEDKDGRKFYRARIILPQDPQDKRNEKMVLRPGMTAQVGIVTGSKSVFAYLFKPIQRAIENSFNER